MYTIIVLLWLSTVFGGEGPGPLAKPPGIGRPVRAVIDFPSEAGCNMFTRELKAYTFEHQVIIGCSKTIVSAEDTTDSLVGEDQIGISQGVVHVRSWSIEDLP